MTPSEAHEWLFQRGWVILSDQYGWPEKKARTMVGKLIKSGGDQLAQRAVIGIQDKRPVEPLPWALAGIAKIQQQMAWKHKPGHRPVANLPPELKPHERADPDRVARKMAEFRREMEET